MNAERRKTVGRGRESEISGQKSAAKTRPGAIVAIELGGICRYAGERDMRCLTMMRMLAGVLVGTVIVGCAQPRASSAVIVLHQGPRSRDGIGAFPALSIDDPAIVHQLQSHFPRYWAQPRSDFYGSWISGYDVYINNGDGSAVHIVVSYNGELWMVGDHGDLEVVGDFQGFVKELQQKSKS